jgi:hypothetical protein
LKHQYSQGPLPTSASSSILVDASSFDSARPGAFKKVDDSRGLGPSAGKGDKRTMLVMRRAEEMALGGREKAAWHLSRERED